MEDSYILQLLKPKFKDFHLCFCGFAECKPLHSYGPAARPNYILHYVMKGKGIYQVGETKYQLKEGQAFLIEPESLTFYQADKTDPWSYLWVGFGGTEAQRFVRDLGLNSRQLTCECEYGEELKEIVFEMLHHTCSTAENLYYLQGKLYQFFSVLARGIEIQQYSNDTKESIHTVSYTHLDVYKRQVQTTQNKKFHNQSHREVRTQPSLFCYAIFYSSFIIPYIFRFENFPIIRTTQMCIRDRISPCFFLNFVIAAWILADTKKYCCFSLSSFPAMWLSFG